MSTNESLPERDDCLDLYVWIHQEVGTDAFSRDRIVRERPHSPEDRGDSAETTTRHLRLLVAYGVLVYLGDDRYRVRCAPTESLDAWQATTASQTEELYRHVQARVRPEQSEQSADYGGRNTLRLDGEQFVGVRVSDADDLADAETAIDDGLDANPESAGIVLRSPGALAADVQRFADRLCDGTGGPADHDFEKLTTDLVGEQKDDLEFRLFLRPTR